MLTTSIKIDTKAADSFNRSLRAYGAANAKAAALAPKVAAFALCDSLRARTKRAPKTPRPREYAIERPAWGGSLEQVGNKRVPKPSPYITYSRGQRLPVALRRYELTRRLGTEHEHRFAAYAYAHIRRNKDGDIVADGAKERAELKRNRLRIARAGLAKKSWNWIKQTIYKGAKSVPERKLKHERRDPADAVDGSYRGSYSASGGSGIAKIVNHLEYVYAALNPGAMEESLRAAAASLAWKGARRSGMTADQAKRYAEEIYGDLKRKESAAAASSSASA